MLKVYVGNFPRNCIVDVSGHFDMVKQKEWFKDPFVRKVVHEIDKSEVVGDDKIESPVFGDMSSTLLSSGCKALILMKMQPEYMVYATRCGDNCAPFICELAEEQDVNIVLHHCMRFPENVHAIFADTGLEVFNYHDFIYGYYDVSEIINEKEE